MDTYSITENCPHDIAVIKIVNTVCTCETIILVCTQCGKELSEAKTEC